MPVRSKTKYPDNWGLIAEIVKLAHNYTCERCNHVHDVKLGYCMTVHHLDGDKANIAWWNLACLCQRCHLYMQRAVFMDQMLFSFVEVSEWFKPHLEGYKLAKSLNNNKISCKRSV
jgi:hypothetical protein